MKQVLNFVKCFGCINWDDHVVFFILLTVTCFHVEQSLHPRNESRLVMVFDPFNTLLKLVC